MWEGQYEACFPLVENLPKLDRNVQLCTSFSILPIEFSASSVQTEIAPARTLVLARNVP